MYVINSRPTRVTAPGLWTLFEYGGGTSPGTQVAASGVLPPSFLSSLTDPVVILIHGYNNTEQQAYDTYWGELSGKLSLVGNGFTGTVMGYDWPSAVDADLDPLFDVLENYQTDLISARNVGAPAFVDFLSQLKPKLPGGIRLNLMAHSMGNYVMRTMIQSSGAIMGGLSNIVSFAPDLLANDLEIPALKTAADGLKGNWFVYWSQADAVLLASNWGNILIGGEQWGGQRLGQQGPANPPPAISTRVVAQKWDSPLAADLGSQYNTDIQEWPFSIQIHSMYWEDKDFKANVAQNLVKADVKPPLITQSWNPL
jgi:hypothetical protein